jgi:hypothetical protein
MPLAIHVLLASGAKDVNARLKAGHDEREFWRCFESD